MVDDDIHKRLTTVEIAHESIKKDQETLRKNQEDIVKDLKQMASNLNEVSGNLSLLVNNVQHLTDSVSKLAEIADKSHQIELDLTIMKSRTDTITKLWDTVDLLKSKVESQSTITAGIKVVAGSVITGAIGLILIHLFGN